MIEMGYLKTVFAGCFALTFYTLVLLMNSNANVSVMDLMILYFVILIWIESKGD